MKLPVWCLPAVVLIALAACDRKPSPAAPPASVPPAAAAEPTAPGTTTGSDAPSQTVGVDGATPVSGEGTGSVEAPDQVNLDPATLENQQVKAEVLKRIDLMPDLPAETKDKLYVQVERARAMGKVITIPFPSGRTTLGSAEIAAVGEKLNLPQVRQLADDPTVVFVVLGFADRKGDPKENQRISLARAQAVLSALQQKLGLLNVMHAVGMGGSDLFDAANLDKNRVVELWAVLP